MDCTGFSQDPVIYKSTQSMYGKAAEIKSMDLTAVTQSFTQHIKLMIGLHIIWYHELHRHTSSTTARLDL